MELFSTMKENSHKSLQSTGRSLSNAKTLTSLCADISPNSSHFFEVIISICLKCYVNYDYLMQHKYVFPISKVFIRYRFEGYIIFRLNCFLPI